MEHLLLVLLGLLLPPQQARGVRETCRPITASVCQGVGYTSTSHPDGVPGVMLQQLGQIVETACSPNIATLMCRFAVPECGSEADTRKKPCRALCQRVKTECEPTLRGRALSWPTRLQCETLPETNCAQGQTSSSATTGSTGSAACQAITVPLCRGLSYTETALPNILGQRTQEEVGQEVQHYGPLVKVNCSPHMKPFLCSVYVPECLLGRARPPCRTLCEQARDGCEPLLARFGTYWPASLRCEQFTTDSCDLQTALTFLQGSGRGLIPLLSSSCEPITVPLCKDMPYTDTILPNALGHRTQAEAGVEIHQFFPLIKTECSLHLKNFLCSVYTPECVSGKARPPCRTLCEEARSGCGQLMTNFGVAWPDALRCDRFTTESCEHYGVGSSGGICEPINIPMCQGLPYNQTLMPNLLGHTSQRDAAVKMSFFNSMVQAMCSVDIRLFLCMVYAPRCSAGEVRRPCRSFCERAKKGCEGLMSSFGVSWPEELRCESFPRDMCISEESGPQMLTAEEVLAKLNAAGFSVRGKSLTLKTARLLLILADADKSGDLDVVEFFKLEHYVAAARREYVETYERRNPPSVTQAQMKKAVAARELILDPETFNAMWLEYGTPRGIDYDEFVAFLTKLHILKDRFQAHLLSLPCDCEVASFSIQQFMKSAII